MEKLLKLREARAMLGISVNAFNSLVDSGVLKPDGVFGTRMLGFYPSTVESARAALKDRAAGIARERAERRRAWTESYLARRREAVAAE